MSGKSHDEAMIELFKGDLQFAAMALDKMLADGNIGELLLTLRQMTKAFGGAAQVAEKANLNRTQIYRTLSKKGNPSVSSLSVILRAMGLRLSVRPLGD